MNKSTRFLIKRNEKEFKILFEYKYKKNILDIFDLTHIIIGKKYLQKLKIMISCLNEKDFDQYILLERAIYFNNSEAIQLILNSNLKIQNNKNYFQATSLDPESKNWNIIQKKIYLIIYGVS